jgi:hypothetical protein
MDDALLEHLARLERDLERMQPLPPRPEEVR